MMKNIKLKSCPFCGRKVKLDNEGESAWMISCKKCGAFVSSLNPYINNNEELIRYWNNRAKIKKEKKLKTCPFCGGKAKLYKDYDSVWTIECQKCGFWVDVLIIQHVDNKKDLIKYWNTRSEAHDD